MAKSKNFIITMPSEVFFMLTAKQRSTYLTIRSFAENGQGVCFASKDEIALRAKVHKQTVYKDITFLKKLGFIKSVGRKIRSVGGKPVEHLVIIDSNGGVSRKQIPTKSEYDLPTTEEYGAENDLPVSRKQNFSKSKVGLHKAEKENIKESRENFSEKSEQNEFTPILAYVYEKVLPFRKNIQDPKSYVEKIASDIASKLLEHKEELLSPQENRLKGRAFKARAELGLEPESNLKNRLKPEWTEADKLWFAVDHSYGWEYLKEIGVII